MHTHRRPLVLGVLLRVRCALVALAPKHPSLAPPIQASAIQCIVCNAPPTAIALETSKTSQYNAPTPCTPSQAPPPFPSAPALHFHPFSQTSTARATVATTRCRTPPLPWVAGSATCVQRGAHAKWESGPYVHKATSAQTLACIPQSSVRPDPIASRHRVYQPYAHPKPTPRLLAPQPAPSARCARSARFRTRRAPACRTGCAPSAWPPSRCTPSSPPPYPRVRGFATMATGGVTVSRALLITGASFPFRIGVPGTVFHPRSQAPRRAVCVG